MTRIVMCLLAAALLASSAYARSLREPFAVNADVHHRAARDVEGACGCDDDMGLVPEFAYETPVVEGEYVAEVLPQPQLPLQLKTVFCDFPEDQTDFEMTADDVQFADDREAIIGEGGLDLEVEDKEVEKKAAVEDKEEKADKVGEKSEKVEEVVEETVVEEKTEEKKDEKREETEKKQEQTQEA